MVYEQKYAILEIYIKIDICGGKESSLWTPDAYAIKRSISGFILHEYFVVMTPSQLFNFHYYVCTCVKFPPFKVEEERSDASWKVTFKVNNQLQAARGYPQIILSC